MIVSIKLKNEIKLKCITTDSYNKYLSVVLQK